ncbi:hypothetical protein [Micromonospora sp. NPDC000729]|uniref:hypothetical protein n=1 Tax=Micromonospora sp. NPDC000729 TaxID=3364220 RepID=UPI003698BC53
MVDLLVIGGLGVDVRTRGDVHNAARYAARVAAAACTHDGMEYPDGLLPRD